MKVVFTLYEMENYKYGSIFLKSKNEDNPFVIFVTPNKKYVVYDTRFEENPEAKEITFYGHSRMTDELTRIDYAKRVVRRLYGKLLKEQENECSKRVGASNDKRIRSLH